MPTAKEILQKHRMNKTPADVAMENGKVYKALFDAVETLGEKVESRIAELEEEVHSALGELSDSVESLIRSATDHVAELEPSKGDKGDEGLPGKSYILTLGDKDEIAGKVKVPIVKQIVKERTIVKQTPVITEVIKNIENKMPPSEIVHNINKTKGVEISAITGLLDELASLKKGIRDTMKRGGGGSKGGGMGNVQHESKLLTSATTSVATTVPISGNGYAIWAYYQGQLLVRGVGYTVSSDRRTLNLLFTPVNGTYVDLIYVR